MLKRTLIITMIVIFSLSLMVTAVEYSYDFGGAEVVIMDRFHEVTQFGERGEYSFLDPSGPVAAQLEEVSEKFNVKLTYIPYVGYENMVEHIMSGVLAGDAEADIYTFNNNHMMQLAREGALYPLADILTDDNYFNRLPKAARQAPALYFREKQYRIYNMNPSALKIGELMTYSKAIIEKEGLTDPYEIWKDGNWDYDSFRELAREATKDTDGDGEIDQWGAHVPYGMHRGNTEIWLGTNNAKPIIFDENGRGLYNMDSEPVIEALSLLTKMIVEDGSFYATHHWEKEWVYPDRNAPDNNALFAVGWGADDLIEQAPDLKLTYIPYPRGPQLSENKALVTADPGWGFGFPITTKHDPRALTELVMAIREMGTPYQDLDELEAEAEEELAMNAPDRQSFEVLNLAADADNHLVMDWTHYWGSFAGEMGFSNTDRDGTGYRGIYAYLSGDRSYGQLRELKPEGQAYLDEFLDQ